MIVNGTFRIKTKTGGGLDDNGNPVKPSETLSEPIDCHIKQNEKDNLGKTNGSNFTVASYVIITEKEPMDAERIKINNGSDLGEFSVISMERLHEVDLTRIMV